MACQCITCKAIKALILGGLGIVVGWLAWYVTKMFIIVVGWRAWNVTKNGITVVGGWTSSAIKLFMSFLFVVFVIIIAVLLLMFFIYILFYLGHVLLLLLATTRSNPNSIITTLIIGGLGIDVGWWAWNVIKMFIIVVEWLEWSAIKYFLIFLLIVFVLLIAVFVLICFNSILFSLPPTPPNPRNPILEKPITLIVGGFAIVVGWWAWNKTKIMMIVFIVITLLYKVFAYRRSRVSPPSRPHSTTTTSSKQQRQKTGPTPSRTSSTSISTWSTEEGYEATATAFSVITGVKIISEKDVQKQRKLGKKVKALDIKDVFYGRLSSSKTKVGDQEQLFYIPDSAYDPPHDYDFTNYKGDDTNCTRGGHPYKRPAGWNRKAVRVIGKYEDDVWLGQQGWRDGSSPGEWPVSYHGTNIQNVPSIVADGYDTKKCVNQAYGPGIYSTPDPKVAEDYATDFNYKGENCKCILQNRVNLKKTKEHKTPMGIYFVTPDDGDIRPYGVCIKKI